MTDRHAGYLVVLDHDIREDDAQRVISALEQIRGVLSVTPVVSGGYAQRVAEDRRDDWWRGRLLNLIHPEQGG